jgi:hypothetical protein
MLSSSNADLSVNCCKAEDKLKELCASLHATHFDNEAARGLNVDLMNLNREKCCERDALTQHVAVLTGQNA